MRKLPPIPPESPRNNRYPWRQTDCGCDPAVSGHRHARPGQLPPGTIGAADPRDDWFYWLLLAGRFYGKTHAGSEFAIEKARTMPGSHGALVAPTADDGRKVMLSAGLENVPGMSGILAVSPPDFVPHYEPSKRTLTWPNGSVATLYSAEEPDRLRGPQHHWGWVDELAAWKRLEAAWNDLIFGMRLGLRPQLCITTTPRPIPLLRRLLKDDYAVITRGRSRENEQNVAPALLDSVLKIYEGTRLGRQELEGEVLADLEGALWQLAVIEASRYATLAEAPLVGDFDRVVVAVDPQASAGTGATDQPDKPETGIVVVARGLCECRGEPETHCFVLEDVSGSLSPNDWAEAAVNAYHRRRADVIVGEQNNGGVMVENTVRVVDDTVNYEATYASRGKLTRAEPVAALYQRGRVHHVGPDLPRLEDQLCSWAGGPPSPNRLDALVWAITKLVIEEAEGTAAVYMRMKLEEGSAAAEDPFARLR